jgi:hypothetical protein
MTTVHYIHMKISSEEWLRYYEGTATHIRCTSIRGRVIHIGARHFRKFTTTEGIEGFFKLTLQNNQFVSIQKIGLS